MEDEHGQPIGTANDNPILNTQLYEVEYLDGHKAAMSANIIADNMFAQVDEEGNWLVLMDEITDHRRGVDAVSQQDAFITTSSGTRRRVETTKGWELLVTWKDGSTNWVSLKDIKNSYPVQAAEYAVANRIAEEPAFAWWVDVLVITNTSSQCHSQRKQPTAGRTRPVLYRDRSSTFAYMMHPPTSTP